MKTINTWKHDQVFESGDGRSQITVDGNAKEGLSPKALLLSGLAACAGIDVVEILQKMRIEFSDLKVEVEADQTDGQPRVFKDFAMRFILRTDAVNRDKVNRAIELSLEKYCGVASMLGKHASIHHKLELLS
jgi:putative redox protein